MKQYRITTDNIPQDSDDDCYLAPDDLIQELKIVQYLAGLGSEARLQEYKAHTQTVNQGSNISVTGTEKAKIMRDNGIRPGDPEWFKLWFSRPLWFNEGPDR
jgi:hypothetical protein